MYLAQVKVRFEEAHIVSSTKIIPCKEQEIDDLERRAGVALPEAYREFLLWMGRGAGDFLQGSSCFYHDLFWLQSTAKELLAEHHFPESLPLDAFVFFMHQGYQFDFFRVGEGNDPSVYLYGDWIEQTSFPLIYAHFSDFLLAEIERFARIRAMRSSKMGEVE